MSATFRNYYETLGVAKTATADEIKSAFRKLARLNKDDPDPHPLEVFLFHSHPPISERLAIADEK